MPVYSKYFGRVCCALVMYSFSLSANSVELRTDPSLSSSVRYSDNLRLSATNKESITGLTLQPKLELRALDEKWDTNVDAKLRSTRYTSDASLDSNSVFFNAGSTYKTELSRYQFNANLDKNTSLDRNIDTALKDAGIDEQQWTRKTQTIGGGWQRQLSEATDVNLNLSHTVVSYGGVVPSNFSGYNTNNASLSYGWTFTERSRLDTSVSLLQFENDLKSFLYDQTIYQLSYGYALNQTDNLRVSIGKRILDSVFVDRVIGCDFESPVDGSCLLNPVFGDIETKNDGNVVNFSFNAKREISQYSINASRTVIPSSVGGASQQDRFALDYRYSFSSMFSTSLKADALDTVTISGLNNSRDAKRRTISLALTYRLSRDMRINFSYQRLSYIRLIDNIDRTSNAITINLYTAWPRLMSTY